MHFMCETFQHYFLIKETWKDDYNTQIRQYINHKLNAEC